MPSYGAYFLLDDGSLDRDGEESYRELCRESAVTHAREIPGIDPDLIEIYTMRHTPRWDEDGNFVEFNDSIGWRAEVA